MLIASRGGSASGSGVGSSSRTKPIKLRAACTQCNAGKVKCSGERTGCERCCNLDLQCIYIESRVGKVPGVRARKRSVHQHINIPRPEQSGVFAMSQSMSGPPSASTMLSDGSDSLVQWSTESNDHGSEIDLLERTMCQPDDQMTDSSELVQTSSMDSELILPEMDFDIDDLLRYPTDQNQDECSPSAMPANEEQDVRRRAELDSQCVLVCCQIASELESYMVADIKSLRIVLGIVRKGVERLNDAVALQQGSRNFRCMAMFGVIMYQIIELLESGCACFLDKNTNRKDSFAVQIQGMLPGIALGGFGMDPEEQSSWRSHIVLKEIQQTSEVLNKIKRLMAVGENGTSSGPSTPEEREKCFVDLEVRLKALSEKVSTPK